jgi:hypothetical protein
MQEEDTISNKSVQLDSIEWSSEHEGILIDWADKSLCFRWLHAKAYEHYSKKNTMYTIPVIIMSTLTGTANFALNRFPVDYQGMATIAIGSVNIIAGIITTIQQFLKIAELNEAHRASSVSWSKLYRNIKLELAKAPNERKQVTSMLNNSKEEYDRLMETSPFIPGKFIRLFKETFSKSSSSSKEERNNSTSSISFDNNIFMKLKKPEVCDYIETTATSLYKPPPPSLEVRKPSQRLSIISNVQELPLLTAEEKKQLDLKIQHEKLREQQEEQLRYHQQQVVDFNKRFKDEKQRLPTSDEINNNFDNSVPFHVILEVLEDLHLYNDKSNKNENIVIDSTA